MYQVESKQPKQSNNQSLPIQHLSLWVCDVIACCEVFKLVLRLRFSFKKTLSGYEWGYVQVLCFFDSIEMLPIMPSLIQRGICKLLRETFHEINWNKKEIQDLIIFC